MQRLDEQYATLSSEGLERRRVDLVLRALDILISGLSLILLSPALVIVTVAILASSGRPLLYRGLRIGRHGHTFHMFKFRTLKPDAETRLGP